MLLSKHLTSGARNAVRSYENRVAFAQQKQKGGRNFWLEKLLQFLHRFNESKVLQMKVRSERLLLNHQPWPLDWCGTWLCLNRGTNEPHPENPFYYNARKKGLRSWKREKSKTKPKKNSSQFRWDGRIPTSEVFFCLWHFSLEVVLASCLKNKANQWAMVADHSNYHWGGESQSFPTNSDNFNKCVLEILASCRQVSSILESIDQKAPLSEFCQKLQWRLPEGSLPVAKVAITKTSKKKHHTLVWRVGVIRGAGSRVVQAMLVVGNEWSDDLLRQIQIPRYQQHCPKIRNQGGSGQANKK